MSYTVIYRPDMPHEHSHPDLDEEGWPEYSIVRCECGTTLMKRLNCLRHGWETHWCDDLLSIESVLSRLPHDVFIDCGE